MLDATGYGAHCWNGTQTPDCEAMGRAYFGIESPGLTSSLAIGEAVAADLTGA